MKAGVRLTLVVDSSVVEDVQKSMITFAEQTKDLLGDACLQAEVATAFEGQPASTCKHCGRSVIRNADNQWVDPNATGDDSIWRETCDGTVNPNLGFTAEHEPEEGWDQPSGATS